LGFGFELRALCFVGWCSTTWAMPLAFHFSYFSGRVSCFYLGPALDCDLPTCDLPRS
jgi:hypothetical protein